MNEVLEILKSLALLAVIVGIIVGLTMLVKYIRTKVKGTQYEEAVNILLDSVDMVNQTFVKALKEAGVFDEEAQGQALEMAISNALSIMNDDLKSYIAKNYGDTVAWMKSIIESKIYNDNKLNDTVSPPNESGTTDDVSTDIPSTDNSSNVTNEVNNSPESVTNEVIE